MNLVDLTDDCLLSCRCDYEASPQQNNLFFVDVSKEHSGASWTSSLHRLSTHKSALIWNFEGFVLSTKPTACYGTHQKLNNQPWPRWSSRCFEKQERTQDQNKTMTGLWVQMKNHRAKMLPPVHSSINLLLPLCNGCCCHRLLPCLQLVDCFFTDLAPWCCQCQCGVHWWFCFFLPV